MINSNNYQNKNMMNYCKNRKNNTNNKIKKFNNN